MLRQRVKTALILALVFLVALFSFSDSLFALFLMIVAGFCAWEWAAISGIKHARSRYYYVAFMLLLYVMFQPFITDASTFRYIMLLALIWWLVVGLVMYLQPIAVLSVDSYSGFYLVSGPLSVIPGLLAAQHLRLEIDGSEWMLLFALSLVWAMDIGAYFSGKKWGKNKLAPSISPGKTREGVYGGLVVLFVLWLFAITVRNVEEPSALALLFAVIIAGGFSVMGDLFESRAKRMVGMKDSGTLLPGHGGVLDRLDSAFVALPLFTFFLLWL